MLSEESEPLREHGCWVWTGSGAGLGAEVLELLLLLPLERVEASD